MSTDLSDPTHPANTQPGLHESELNPLNRDNPGPMGTVASFLGFGMALGAMDGITEAIGGGLEDGLFTEVGAMPEGSAFDGVTTDLAAMQPAPTPQMAPQTNPTAGNPFMIQNPGANGPGGFA